MWWVESGRLVYEWKLHLEEINDIDISDCNKYLASCSDDATLKISDYIHKKYFNYKHPTHSYICFIYCRNNPKHNNTNFIYLFSLYFYLYYYLLFITFYLFIYF